MKVVGRRPAPDKLTQLLPLWCRVALASPGSDLQTAEIEIAFGAGEGTFSDHCDCRVLIVPRGSEDTAEALVADAELHGSH